MGYIPDFEGSSLFLGDLYFPYYLLLDPVIAVVSSLLIGAVLLGVLTSVVLRRRPAHAA